MLAPMPILHRVARPASLLLVLAALGCPTPGADGGLDPGETRDDDAGTPADDALPLSSTHCAQSTLVLVDQEHSPF